MKQPTVESAREAVKAVVKRKKTAWKKALAARDEDAKLYKEEKAYILKKEGGS